MKWIELGQVTRPHGFKGELVVVTSSGDRSSLGSLEAVQIGTSPENSTSYPVLESAWMPRGWKLKLAGISSDTQVLTLKGQKVFAERAKLPSTESDEYYIADLEGCEVRSVETREIVGTFKGVESTGNDRWWIEKDGEEFAVPANKRYVDKVDTEARVIWLRNLRDFEE